MKYFFLSFLLILVLSSESRYKKFTPRKTGVFKAPQIKVSFFYNYVDHFNHMNKAKYPQRYGVIDQYWNQKNNYGFIYIDGEGPSDFEGEASSLFPSQYAQSKGAYFVILEHRFYGDSQPMPDWTLKSLKFLNHEQSLADTAFFLESLNYNISSLYGVPPLKWIVFGGSYAGALSAWLKYKYPHLVIGSIASSGVVHPFVEFYQYEGQIKKDLMSHSMDCFNKLKQFQSIAEQNINDPSKRDEFMEYFNASFLSIPDFYMYFSDIYVGYIQYSQRKYMCEKVLNISDSLDIKSKMMIYAKIGQDAGVTPEDYKPDKLINTTINSSLSDRQWTYQYCSAYGWFQIPDIVDPIRWAGLNVNYYMNQCEKAFGIRFFPSAEHINILWGGESIANSTFNTVFLQGSDDPWQWAGVHSSDSIGQSNYFCLNDCDDCGHCRDLDPESPDDPDGIKHCREIEKTQITNWIQNLTYNIANQ